MAYNVWAFYFTLNTRLQSSYLPRELFGTYNTKAEAEEAASLVQSCGNQAVIEEIQETEEAGLPHHPLD